MPQAGETPPTLVKRVLGHANEVHQCAHRWGQAELTALLDEEAKRWGENATTIVIAGAQKRGKSRLINALVAHPDLVPVDVDIATHTHLVLKHGPKLRAQVRRRTADGEVLADITPEEVAQYASTWGDPALRRDVAGVELSVDHPLLAGVRLVDTPGVDSLTIGHRHSTVAMLAQADVLLFALSAQDQPVLRHELEFLVEAVGRIRTVVFVLTKVEDSSSWQELLAENKRRLSTFLDQQAAEHPEQTEAFRMLRGAPWVPVSAKLAEAATARRAAGQAERADELWARSGMARLTAVIRSCADSREVSRSGRVLAASSSVRRALLAAEEDRAAGGAPDGDDAKTRLQAVQDELDGLTDRARERRRAAIEHQFLGREAASFGRTGIERVKRSYDQAVSGLNNHAAVEAFMRDLPDSLERSLQAVWSEALADTQRLLIGTLGDFLRRFELDPLDVDLASLGAPDWLRPQLQPRLNQQGGIDVIREGVPTAAMAASLGMLLGALTIPVIGLVVGPLLAGGVLMRRRQLDQVNKEQAAVRKLLNEIFSSTATEMALTLERAVASWRGEAEQCLDEALASQRRHLEQRRKDLAALAARDSAGRKDAAATAAERLRTLRLLAERATGLQAEVTEALSVLSA